MSANKILRGHTALLKPLSPESFAEAIGYFERALAHDPGSVAAKASLAGTLAGRVLKQSRSDYTCWLPRVPNRPDEAIVWLEKAREANPTRSFPYAGLASAHALEGDIERASAELADALPARASFALHKFPVTRENTGNFIDSSLGGTSTVAKRGVKSVPYAPIPYASEQGIF